jgi:hypothetical protein
MLDFVKFPPGGPTAHPPCGVHRAIRINGGASPLPIRYVFVDKEEGPYLDVTYPVGTRDLPEQANERIKLLSTRVTFGGVRWYLSCPFTTE